VICRIVIASPPQAGAAISNLRMIEIASVAALPHNDTQQLNCYRTVEENQRKMGIVDLINGGYK